MRRVFFIIRKVILLTIVIAFCSCSNDDQNESIRTPLVRDFEVKEYIQWIDDEFSDWRQRTEFFFDDKGRLIKHEFSSNLQGTLPEGSWEVKRYVDYSYDNQDHLTRSETTVIIENQEFLVGIKEYFYEEGLISRIKMEIYNEGSGEFAISEVFYDYNANGLVEAIYDEFGERTEYIYEQGGLVESRSINPQGQVYSIISYQNTNTPNPFVGLPPQSGIIMTFWPSLESEVVPFSFSAAEPGVPPASVGSAEYITDSAGRVLRADITITNTFPEVSTLLITEIKYLE